MLASSFYIGKGQETEETIAQSYSDLFSQTNGSESQFGAIANMTQIGDQTYVGIRLRPEFNIKKFGIGLDVPVLVNVDNGDIRTEEYKTGIGALRLIRFVKYGTKKKDPVFVRFGDISETYLGYGNLVNNYSNSASFERRKLGLSWDILVKKIIGIEGFYSDIDLESPNLFGVRPYIKPLATTSIPIIKTTEIGFTYVQDKDNTSSQYNENGEVTRSGYLNNTFNAMSLDIGWDLVKTKIFKAKAFAEYSMLTKNEILSDTATAREISYGAGNGKSVGIIADVKIFGDFLRINSRLERLWYSDNYLPQFFDILYEINKDNKFETLLNAESKQGIYGTLNGTVLGKFKIGGSLLLPDNITENSPAYLRLDASADKLADKFSAHATYMRGNIARLKEAIKIDENSFANARLTYQLNKYLVTGVDYRWTFSKNEETGKVEASSYWMPYFGMNIPL